ncbi:MAG: hypothetical protein AAGC47_14240, partial [Bacteroidota bacterium]
MRRIFLAVFTAVVFVASASCQSEVHSSFEDLNVEIGSSYKPKFMRELTYSVMNDDGSIIGVAKGRRFHNGSSDHTFFLYRFDSNLNLKLESELKMPDKRTFVKKVLFSGDKLAAIVSDFDKKMESKTTYIQSIDPKSLALKSDTVHISSVTKERKGDGIYSEEFLISELPDGTEKIMLSRLFKDSTGFKTYTLSQFDKSLQLVKNIPLKLNIADDYSLDKLHYLNQNTALISVLPDYPSKKEREKKIPVFLRLIKIDLKTGGTEKFEFNINDSYVFDFKFYPLSNDEIACVGFYSLSGRATFNGSFFLVLDSKSLKMNNLYSNEFEQSFIKEDLTTKELRSLEKSEKDGDVSGIRYLECDGVIKTL